MKAVSNFLSIEKGGRKERGGRAGVSECESESESESKSESESERQEERERKKSDDCKKFEAVFIKPKCFPLPKSTINN